MRRLVLLLVGVLTLAACGSDADAGGPDVAGVWQLTAGTAGGTPLPQPTGAGATLDLSAGEASGVAFCNRFFASYELRGSSLSIGEIGSTEMGCEPDVMAAESAYLAALAAVDTVTMSGGEMVLSGDGVELRFGPVPAVPDSPLAGTRWVLESLIDGETASSTLGDPAVLLLAPDRGAEATTGCRSLTGTWRDDGGALVLDDLLQDGTGCPPDLARQDEHVTAVLGSGPALELREDRLTLTAPDGRGLVYRAP